MYNVNTTPGAEGGGRGEGKCLILTSCCVSGERVLTRVVVPVHLRNFLTKLDQKTIYMRTHDGFCLFSCSIKNETDKYNTGFELNILVHQKSFAGKN